MLLYIMRDSVGLDIVAATNARGEPIAGNIRVNGELTTLPSTQLKDLEPGLGSFGGKTYFVNAIAVNLGSEFLGEIIVGRELALSEFSSPVVLTSGNRVVKSNLAASDVEKLEEDLAACDGEIDCETTLGDETYLIVSLEGLRLGSGFELRSLQSVESAAAPIQAVVVNVFLMVGSVVLFGGIFLAWVVSRSVVRPLTGLVHDMKTRLVSHKKDYSVRAPRRGEDELGALVGAFDEMLVHIENHEADLQQQVEGRTAELTATNADLREARDKAEEGTRLKSQFLANISHEIRTPMNVILGMTELAQDTVSDAEREKYLGMVRDAGDALLTIINDVLDFSKVEAGKVELQTSEFNVRDTLVQMVKFLGLKASKKGLKLAWDVGAAVPERVNGDAGRLQQVLVNLVGNAIKFTNEGNVLVRAELEDGDETSIRFSVTDTGVGIPTDMQRVIFEPFRQVDGSLTRRFGGTGLGLAIASQLVEAMGGRIWMDSEVGKGSAFHFTARFTQPEPDASAESESGRPRVVVPIWA